MIDEITQAVLSREEIARHLQGSTGESSRAARERIEAYLEELRTRQRYSIYRALKHPLYPILRKIERRGENVEIAKAATRAGRVIYASNHAAAMRPSITRRDLEGRADALIDSLGSGGANLGVKSGDEAVAAAIEPLEARGILVVNRGRVRVRNRNVRRYYAHSLDHLLESPSRGTR